MLKLKLQHFGHLAQKIWLIGKDPDAEEDWRQEKGMSEDEMDGWYHWLIGHEFEQTLGDGKVQRSLVCYSPGGHNESDKTEQVNNNIKENTN